MRNKKIMSRDIPDEYDPTKLGEAVMPVYQSGNQTRPPRRLIKEEEDSGPEVQDQRSLKNTFAS